MIAFSQEQVDALVSQLNIPEGHTSAVALTSDTEGVKLVAAVDWNIDSSRWELGAAAEHEWSGEDKAGARLLVSW